MSTPPSNKSKRRKDIVQWWSDRINDLRRESDKLYQQDPTVYEVGPQAVSKLAILSYYIDVYTKIMKNQFKSKEICYVDLFAGCGLCKIKGSDDVILGSATIASYIPQQNYKFDKYVLIEKDSSFASALKKRIPNAKVIDKDVNGIHINKLLDNYCGNNNPILAFIDPEGLELKWKTLEQILQRWSDVIINYHPVAVRRVVGKADEMAETLTEFFGTTKWQKLEENEQEFLELYKQKIMQYKQVVESIKVQGKSTFYYYIIVATRKTRGRNPWLRAIHQLKNFIEKTPGDIIQTLLDIYRGKQATL